MECQVSAFSMYKAKKNSNKDKKNKKKKTRAAAASGSTSGVQGRMIQIAQKVKKLQKEPKIIGKKKTHKKKKTKNVKPNQKVSRPRKSPTDSESENIPILIPAEPVASPTNDEGVTSSDQSSSSDSEVEIPFTTIRTDSTEEGLRVFRWMIAPWDAEQFLNQIWEKKPLHIARNRSAYYKHLISTPAIDNMLRTHNIQYTKNIDITSYEDGVRETHNPDGRAHPHIVWDYYLTGCSIRLLNPQTFLPKLHLLNATMQEFFNSFIGANAYLTPPDSQGFAPHYDDIEAFILQVEGKKRWRIYKPRFIKEVLPRTSSKNFDQEQIGEPIMEVTLKPGDMLYFPKGFIHQAETINGQHSLHITISMFQKQSWADLFEKLLPAALQTAIHKSVVLRRGLPFDIFDNFGLVYSDTHTPRRFELTSLVESLFDKIKDYMSIDAAVDQMHKAFQHDALPPVLSDAEKAVTVFGAMDVMTDNGNVTNRVELQLDNGIRLLRKNILRMVSEEKIRIYYSIDNSLEYHEYEQFYMDIEPKFGPGVETLINAYPQYIKVESLDLADNGDKCQLADALWSRGLLMTHMPLEFEED